MFSLDLPITIRFEDADPAGVVFYPRAIALAHSAVEELIRRSTLGWDTWFASATHAAPLRRAEADFFLPMKVGQSFVARASVEKMGATSVTFLVEFRNASGLAAAQVHTVHVIVDKSTGQPVHLTSAMQAAFAVDP